MERSAASIRLSPCEPHHLAPLLGFLGDERAEVRGRTRKHRAAEVSEPRFYVGIGEASVDLLAELRNDLSRRILGCAEAIPIARLVARHELTHGRDAGQHFRARGGGYRERAQPTSPDIPYR